MRYRRIMLKLSGEALGEQGWLFDHAKIREVAGILCEVRKRGVQAGVVIGGGNLWRGRHGASEGMDAVTADQMGMLGTVMNCLVMRDALAQCGQKSEVFSALSMPDVCTTYRFDLADAALERDGLAFLGGGLGRPFFTTDTAVTLRALELKADALLLAKNVDGVYTADPRTDKGAKLIRDITYGVAIQRELKVMDLAAFQMCAEQSLPQVRVFGLSDPRNILRVLEGEDLGTTLHP